jgi:hypothetical protein
MIVTLTRRKTGKPSVRRPAGKPCFNINSGPDPVSRPRRVSRGKNGPGRNWTRPSWVTCDPKPETSPDGPHVSRVTFRWGEPSARPACRPEGCREGTPETLLRTERSEANDVRPRRTPASRTTGLPEHRLSSWITATVGVSRGRQILHPFDFPIQHQLALSVRDFPRRTVPAVNGVARRA